MRDECEDPIRCDQIVPLIFRAALVLFFFVSFQSVPAQASPTPAEAVRSVLAASDSELNYLGAKLVFDRIIDPSIDDAAIAAQVDTLAAEAKAIAGAGASDVDKLKAVRQVLYDSGMWNQKQPFSYDHEDPLELR